MTDRVAEEAVWRMRGIAGALRAAGFDARLHETRGSVDLTAVRRVPGRPEVEAVVDEDGYVELRYWSEPGATPAQVAAGIDRALAAISGAPAG